MRLTHALGPRDAVSRRISEDAKCFDLKLLRVDTADVGSSLAARTIDGMAMRTGVEASGRRESQGMRAGDDLPADVVRFVNDSIDSLEQLELLTLLMNTRSHWWDAAAVGLALGLSAWEARQGLETLASRNLLAIAITNDVRYRFEPGTAALRESIDDFAEAYRRSPLAVVKIVTTGERRAIRDFADAFRIRRRDHR